MNNILVTGGSGFIGTNLINYLDTKKYKITNIDKLSNVSTPEKFKIVSKNYKFYKINLSNKKRIQSILKSGFNTIIHLAAESHVDRSIDNPKKFFSQNIDSTLTFYNEINYLVKKKKISMPNIIHISTDEVYGSIKKGLSNENTKFFTSSPYSASKAACENIAQFFMETYKLNICILRITNNYGPYQFPEKFIPKVILRILSKKDIPVYGNGKNIREWIYVEDTCKAIHLIIKKFKNKKIFNIGSSERISNIDALNKIFNKFNYPQKKIKFIKDRPGHDFRYALNSNNFKRTFDWKIKNNFKKGIGKTINWYLNNPKWINEIKRKYKDNRLGKL